MIIDYQPQYKLAWKLEYHGADVLCFPMKLAVNLHTVIIFIM